MNVDVETREQALWYLAGIIDGEGHIEPRSRVIMIVNSDYALIEACIDCCVILKYNHWITEQTRPDGRHWWHFNISRRSTLTRAADELPLQAPCKRDALKWVADSYIYPLSRCK